MRSKEMTMKLLWSLWLWAIGISIALGFRFNKIDKGIERIETQIEQMQLQDTQ